MAAVQTLAMRTEPQAADLLLAGWSGYSPAVRREVQEALFARADRLPSLLAAIEKGQVQVSQLDLARREQLLKNPSAAIRDRAHIAAVRRANADLRDWFTGALRPLGFETGQSHGNFLLLPFADAATAATAHGHLKRDGIMLRPMDGYGLSHCLRVTLGIREEMELLLQSLAAWREGRR